MSPGPLFLTAQKAIYISKKKLFHGGKMQTPDTLGANDGELKLALLPGERVIYKAKHGPLAFLKFLPSSVAVATNKRFMIFGGFIRQNNVSISYDGISAVHSERKLLWSNFIFHINGQQNGKAAQTELKYLKKIHALALFSIVSNQIAYSKGEPPHSAYDPSQYAYRLPIVNGPPLTNFVRKEKASIVGNVMKKVSIKAKSRRARAPHRTLCSLSAAASLCRAS